MENPKSKPPKRTEFRHGEGGREYLDPVPLEPPLGYRRQVSLADQIRQQVRLERLRAWEAEFEAETEEEADDFEVEDEFEPMSPHENDYVPTIAQLKEQAREINERIRMEHKRRAVEEYKKEKAKLEGGEPSPPNSQKEPSEKSG